MVTTLCGSLSVLTNVVRYILINTPSAVSYLLPACINDERHHSKTFRNEEQNKSCSVLQEGSPSSPETPQS